MFFLKLKIHITTNEKYLAVTPNKIYYTNAYKIAFKLAIY